MPDLRIRDVPPEIMQQLKAKAALAGMYLQDYVIALIRRDVTRKQKGAA